MWDSWHNLDIIHSIGKWFSKSMQRLHRHLWFAGKVRNSNSINVYHHNQLCIFFSKSSFCKVDLLTIILYNSIIAYYFLIIITRTRYVLCKEITWNIKRTHYFLSVCFSLLFLFSVSYTTVDVFASKTISTQIYLLWKIHVAVSNDIFLIFVIINLKIINTSNYFQILK